MTTNKQQALKRLSNEKGIIGALAIDQRGSLKKMLGKGSAVSDTAIEQFKVCVSEELTPYASSILLDPEYGLPAAQARASNAGLLIAYEKTGYDANSVGRLPDLLPEWSVKRIKEEGADGVKFLLYYDVDEDVRINEQKHVFMERVGSECKAEDIPFFLEIVTYDATDEDVTGEKYAKVKPHKVIEAMKEFSKAAYQVDVLKVEVPVTMNYVEGFGDTTVYSREEALAHFKAQSDATTLPFIFLSAGVSAQLFQDTLRFAAEAGSTFNGVLCGRATWKDSTVVYANEGEAIARDWLKSQGKANMAALNNVLNETATPLFN